MALLPLYSMDARLHRPARLRGAGRQGDGRQREEGEQPPACAAVPFHPPFPSGFTGIVFSATATARWRLLGHGHRGRPTCSPGTSSRSSSSPTPAPGWRRRVSQWVSLLVKVGALLFAIELPRFSTILSRSAASGSCRLSRRSCPACSRAGSTAMPCSRAGWSACSYGMIAAYNVVHADHLALGRLRPAPCGVTPTTSGSHRGMHLTLAVGGA